MLVALLLTMKENCAIAGSRRWAACLIPFVAGAVLVPASDADPGVPGPVDCVALGQINESLQDAIGPGLNPGNYFTPGPWYRYDITRLVHGMNYMNQVNGNDHIQQLNGPLADISATISDLKDQEMIVTNGYNSYYGSYMTPIQEQDLQQASAQQDTLEALVGQLQQSNHCPAPPSE